MKLTDKFKQYLKKNNQTTTNNRKKVGIILFATSIGLFFLFVTRLSYIVIVGDVAGTSLAEKTKIFMKAVKSSKRNVERSMTAMGFQLLKM